MSSSASDQNLMSDSCHACHSLATKSRSSSGDGKIPVANNLCITTSKSLSDNASVVHASKSLMVQRAALSVCKCGSHAFTKVSSSFTVKPVFILPWRTLRKVCKTGVGWDVSIGGDFCVKSFVPLPRLVPRPRPALSCDRSTPLMVSYSVAVAIARHVLLVMRFVMADMTCQEFITSALLDFFLTSSSFKGKLVNAVPK